MKKIIIVMSGSMPETLTKQQNYHKINKERKLHRKR